MRLFLVLFPSSLFNLCSRLHTQKKIKTKPNESRTRVARLSHVVLFLHFILKPIRLALYCFVFVRTDRRAVYTNIPIVCLCMHACVCVCFYNSVNSFGPLDMAINSFCFRLVRHFLFTHSHLSRWVHIIILYTLYLRSIYNGQQQTTPQYCSPIRLYVRLRRLHYVSLCVCVCVCMSRFHCGHSIHSIVFDKYKCRQNNNALCLVCVISPIVVSVFDNCELRLFKPNANVSNWYVRPRVCACALHCDTVLNDGLVQLTQLAEEK